MTDDTPTRMKTRPRNATAHPGLVVAPTKRTRDDGRTKKDVAKERKQAKEQKLKANVRKVATLEKRMAKDEEVVNFTPKPGGKKYRKLRRTYAYAEIPLTKAAAPDPNDSGVNNTEDGTHDGDTESNTTDDEAPPKKKSKPGFRDAVQKYLDEDHHSNSGSAREHTKLHADDAETAESESDTDEVVPQTVTPTTSKKPAIPKPATQQKHRRAANNGDNSDSDSVIVVVKKKKCSANQKRPGTQEKPDMDDTANHEGLIEDWAAKVPHNARPGRSRSKATPSLTCGSTRGSYAPPSTRSALNSITISDRDDGIKVVEGGLSDADETRGVERDAAIKSPLKGKQRIRSSALIKVEDSSQRAILPPKRRAKPSNDKLPKEWLEDGVWRKKIIPCIFRWAGIQENPWVIPDEKIADALTKICDMHFGDVAGHPITPNSEPVSQRLSEWRSSFGSAAIAIVNGFFDDNDAYRESNDMRRQFATRMLDKLRFVYRYAKGDDPKKFRGLFRNLLIVQTFAAHFNAISGSRWVDGLYDGDTPPKARPALGMATAAVERVLMLWSSGNLSIEIVQEAKDTKKAIKLPVMINPVTGRQSVRYSAFSEVSWGKPTRAFIKSTKNVDDEGMESIMEEAKDFARVSRYKDEANDDVDSEDDRANLEDGSDGELSAMAMDV